MTIIITILLTVLVGVALWNFFNLNSKKDSWIIISVVLNVVLIMGLNLMVMLIYFDKPTDRGTFGDMFGFANALFSGLAFAGVIYTLYRQSKDLELQRFETSFFQLLTLQSEIVKSMDFQRRESQPTVGRDVFRTYYNELETSLAEYKAGLRILKLKRSNSDNSKPLYNYKIDLPTMIRKYNDLFEERESDLGHYFRSLYHIYRFIDQSNIEDKTKYAGILRSQLSLYELLFLFYNGLSGAGRNFKERYMDKYEVLRNMSWNRIFDMSHLSQYDHLKGPYQEYLNEQKTVHK